MLLLSFLLLAVERSSAALRRYILTLHSDVRAPGGFTIGQGRALRTACQSSRVEVNSCSDGVPREMYRVNGQQPGPLVEDDEGDDHEIFVKNDLPVRKHDPLARSVAESRVLPTAQPITCATGLIQPGTPHMDGVPGVTQVGL